MLRECAFSATCSVSYTYRHASTNEYCLETNNIKYSKSSPHRFNMHHHVSCEVHGGGRGISIDRSGIDTGQIPTHLHIIGWSITYVHVSFARCSWFVRHTVCAPTLCFRSPSPSATVSAHTTSVVTPSQPRRSAGDPGRATSSRTNGRLLRVPGPPSTSCPDVIAVGESDISKLSRWASAMQDSCSTVGRRGRGGSSSCCLDVASAAAAAAAAAAPCLSASLPL